MMHFMSANCFPSRRSANDLGISSNIHRRFGLTYPAQFQSAWSNLFSAVVKTLISMYVLRLSLIRSKYQLCSPAPWTTVLIVINHTCSYIAKSQFMAKVTTHCERWRSFKVIVTDPHIQPHVQTVLKSLFNLRLPRLTELEYSSSTVSAQADEFQFYTTAKIPNLRRLTTGRLTLLAPACPQFRLRSCSITLGITQRPDWKRSIEKLWAFLDSQSELEELQLMLSRIMIVDWGVTPETPVPPKTVRLVHLWRLHLFEERGYPGSEQIIPMLIGCLHIPSISTIVLRLTLVLSHFSFDDIFSPLRDCRSLEDVTLSVDDRRPNRPALPSPFLTTFQRVLSIRRFTIEWSGSSLRRIDPFDDGLATPPPHLELLHVSWSPDLGGSALVSIIRYLSRGEGWSRFKSLRITQCPDVVDAVYAIAHEIGLAVEKIVVTPDAAPAWKIVSELPSQLIDYSSCWARTSMP